MTTLLAIDSSTGPCSVALLRDRFVVAYEQTTLPVMQSARLMPMVEHVLKNAKADYKDLDKVVTTLGPGSFTGIRVGLSAARGIAFAAGIESEGYTTLEVLAHAARSHLTEGVQTILAITNAGKGEWYYQYYNIFGTKMSDVRLDTLESALAGAKGNILVCGNAPLPHPPPHMGEEKIISCEVTFPRADQLAMLADAQEGETELKPFYIRPPDAKPQFPIHP